MLLSFYVTIYIFAKHYFKPKKEIMNKIKILVGFILLSTVTTYAQLTSAAIAIDDNNEVKIAKELIDKYMSKEKSANDPKGWYYKGYIYERIATSNDEAIRKLDADPLTKSVEGYSKSISLDKPNGEWAKKSKEKSTNLWPVVYNKGIEYYQASQFSDALRMMELSQNLKPSDTTSYVNAALIALQAKDYAFAKKTYYKLLELNKNPNYYRNLMYAIQELPKKTKQDTLDADEEMLKVVQMARKEFPKDPNLMAQEVNLYISAKRQNEAIAKLTEAIETDPSNAKLYYFNLGILHKQLNEDAKAKDYFQKSLKIDSLAEESNYMMGLMLMEEGDAINKKLNKMTYQQSISPAGKKEEDRREALYRKAIPYFEKSYRVNKDPKLKIQLEELYKRFKMNDKLSKLK